MKTRAKHSFKCCSKCYIIFKKVHVLSEISPEELPGSRAPGSENGDKQLRSVSVINLTADFEFRETPIKSLSS